MSTIQSGLRGAIQTLCRDVMHLLPAGLFLFLPLLNRIEAKIREAGLDKQWQLLQSLPGVQATSAATILAETGPDMEQFGDPGHLSSWVGVCPGSNRSAGKSKSSRTTGGNPWLRSALRECAQAAAKKKGCFLKDKYWRIVTKSGGKKSPAGTAVAHTSLLLAYQVLSTGQPYRDKQAAALEPQQKERMIRHHVRRLGKLGVVVCSPRAASRRTSKRAAKVRLRFNPPTSPFNGKRAAGKGVMRADRSQSNPAPKYPQFSEEPNPKIEHRPGRIIRRQ